MKPRKKITPSPLAALAVGMFSAASPAFAQDKPNILFIMGDDIG
ncbi:MAG: hypothetical protein ACHBNF_21805 [Chromatiales bacterium]